MTDEQKCLLCKTGTYKLYANTDTPKGRAVIENAGIRPAGGARLVIQRCDHCGHLLIIKPWR